MENTPGQRVNLAAEADKLNSMPLIGVPLVASTAPTTAMIGWERSKRDDTHTAHRHGHASRPNHSLTPDLATAWHVLCPSYRCGGGFGFLRVTGIRSPFAQCPRGNYDWIRLVPFLPASIMCLVSPFCVASPRPVVCGRKGCSSGISLPAGCWPGGHREVGVPG